MNAPFLCSCCDQVLTKFNGMQGWTRLLPDVIMKPGLTMQKPQRYMGAHVTRMLPNSDLAPIVCSHSQAGDAAPFWVSMQKLTFLVSLCNPVQLASIEPTRLI